MVSINYSASTDFTTLDQRMRLVDSYADELQEAVYDVAVAENDYLIKSVVQNPPRFAGKREWQSEKQRKAYFASGGFGKGIPYLRTGDLNDAWEVGFNVQPGSIEVNLRNFDGKLRFVVGGLRLTDPPSQQRMHAQSGWKLVAPIIAADSIRFKAKVLVRLRRIPLEFK